MSGFRQVSKAQARTHLSRDERITRLEGVVLPLETAEEYVEEISRLWKDAQNTFLTIGRYLNQAMVTLQLDKEGGQTFQGFVENNLPFGYQVAYQLRKVAEAIDGNRLMLEELPPSYATIYQFTTLTDADLDKARHSQPPLLRPTVKREEIVAFKRQLAREKVSEEAVPPARRLAQLQRRRKTLIAQRDKILAELAEIEREIGA